ncbi:hypothetical protein GCM10009092_14590 [Bowmanella denitrificans]|uniref:Serine aminopeptidase S33 domain-containing protein n=1 Tax=Bowmanella denitrificans TaxID=366582 RepID=A0ABP3GP21_9ALTE
MSAQVQLDKLLADSLQQEQGCIRMTRICRVCLGLALLLAMAACGLAPDYTQERVRFHSKQDELYGTLILPTQGQGPFPVILFVHGDGALPFDAQGYYRPYWQALAQQGIAAFAWDKPGVGGSSGDWLAQSMQDRANEVLAAIDALKQHQDKVQAEHVGVIGFSQAGWVLPKLAPDQHKLQFMILVSTAINWEQQGQYHRQKRLENQQADVSLVTEALQQNADYAQYQQLFSQHADKDDKLLDKSRYDFVRVNWQSDASQDLKALHLPVLAVFGQADLNVDINNSQTTYADIFSALPAQCYQAKVYPQATHSMTKANWLNQQSPGLATYALIQLTGQHFFVDGVLTDISQWAAQQFASPATECRKK